MPVLIAPRLQSRAESRFGKRAIVFAAAPFGLYWATGFRKAMASGYSAAWGIRVLNTSSPYCARSVSSYILWIDLRPLNIVMR